MKIKWQLQVYDDQTLRDSVALAGIVEVGRQRDLQEKLLSPCLDGRFVRVAIVPIEDQSISRRHLLVEPVTPSLVRLTNVSTKLPMTIEDGGTLEPGETREVELPGSVRIGAKVLRLEGDRADAEFRQLSMATLAPGRSLGSLVGRPQMPPPGLDLTVVSSWLQAVMAVLQSAVNSDQFFDRAANALVDLVGLDSGRVLLAKEGGWHVAAYSCPRRTPNPEWQPSQRLVAGVVKEKRTFWKLPSQYQGMESLAGIDSVIAAPIMDLRGTVIGVLYGDRRINRLGSGEPPITEAQAILVELLASGIAAGMARVEQEKAALRARIQFDQFFTPELARHLEKEPDLLRGRSAEVTLLFCDIRGFSRISERVGSAQTLAWISDVLESLSACVLRHRGVVVDYLGDEMIAMWGAPEAQPDHAQLACRAALDLLSVLPAVSERWSPITQEATKIGIGINTGAAHVGNIGTSRKFKYGPLGNAVNLASRLQSLTKQLHANLLISGQTRALIGEEFAVRRLCRARVVNIQEPIDIFEVSPPGHANWAECKQAYEQALEAFEAGDLTSVARAMGNLLSRFPDDGPSLMLVGRAMQSFGESGECGKIWEFTQK